MCRIASKRRYEQSRKGRDVQERYNASKKGRDRAMTYDCSTKGIIRRVRAELSAVTGAFDALLASDGACSAVSAASSAETSVPAIRRAGDSIRREHQIDNAPEIV